MKRLDYETLAMEEVAVEMECGFLSASVVSTDSNRVETTGHELNDITLGADHDSWNTSSDGKNGWE